MARKTGKVDGSSNNMNSEMNTSRGGAQNRIAQTLSSNDVMSSSQMSSRDLASRRTIVGVFDDREDAERAIHELKDAGFSGDQIGIAMRDRNAQGQLVEDTGTHAAQGAVTGAVGGGILGGLTGLLIGIGALAIPGIGPVVAGGVFASAFGTAAGTAVAGAGIGAAAGGIVGALVGMGVPEEEARYFESGFKSGGVLVSVNAQNRAMEALGVLDRNGADTGNRMNTSLHESSDDTSLRASNTRYEDVANSKTISNSSGNVLDDADDVEARDSNINTNRSL